MENKTISTAPMSINKREEKRIFFVGIFSNNIPVGIDAMPYAIKKENGRRETNVRFILKSWIKSGIMLPKIFVIREITKKHTKTRITK